jgi:hypothetical protein
VRATQTHDKAKRVSGSSRRRPTGLTGQTMHKQLAKPLRKAKVATPVETSDRQCADGQALLETHPRLGLTCHLNSRPKTGFDCSELDSYLAHGFYQRRQESKADNYPECLGPSG